MSDITIPPEALEAAAKAAHDQWRHECAVVGNEPVENWREWSELEEAERLSWIEQTRAACLAMLKAWPGMYDEKDTPWSKASTIHLPLTQESEE